jgi:hypothetical protein
LNFNSPPQPGSDGVPTSYPVHLAVGELLDLATVPVSQRQAMVEGLDYRKAWTHEEQSQLKRSRSDIYRESEADQPTAGLMRRNR